MLALRVVLFLFGSLICSEISHLTDQWITWKSQHNKTYRNTKEEVYRRSIWEKNLQEVLKHNEEAGVGLHTFTLGLNHLSDMTADEINSLLNGLMEEDFSDVNLSPWTPPPHPHLPSRVDWNKHGVVSPVRNQGQCGSCWAFSAIGALEGQMKIKTGVLVPLSPQNLLDCSVSLGNHGCEGGHRSRAFRYIIQNKGIDSDRSYPYEHKLGSCRYTVTGRAGYCSGFHIIPKHNETALQIAVADVGPISVSINSNLPSFHRYRSGIYNDPKCSSESVTHAVLIVGYGSEHGKDYWLVKNSWGTDWGERGFFRIARNKNMCGISNLAIYPKI